MSGRHNSTIDKPIEQPIIIYTDGGCSGNPGPGAWAFYVPTLEYHESGSVQNTTNNRMELLAAIQALSWLQRKFSYRDAQIYTDSLYLKMGITEWMNAWVRNNWRTKSKKPVLNRQLWEELSVLNKKLTVSWNWVRGHDEDVHNQRCDELVQKCIADELGR